MAAKIKLGSRMATVILQCKFSPYTLRAAIEKEIYKSVGRRLYLRADRKKAGNPFFIPHAGNCPTLPISTPLVFKPRVAPAISFLVSHAKYQRSLMNYVSSPQQHTLSIHVAPEMQNAAWKCQDMWKVCKKPWRAERWIADLFLAQEDEGQRWFLSTNGQAAVKDAAEMKNELNKYSINFITTHKWWSRA